MMRKQKGASVKFKAFLKNGSGPTPIECVLIFAVITIGLFAAGLNQKHIVVVFGVIAAVITLYLLCASLSKRAKKTEFGKKFLSWYKGDWVNASDEVSKAKIEVEGEREVELPRFLAERSAKEHRKFGLEGVPETLNDLPTLLKARNIPQHQRRVVAAITTGPLSFEAVREHYGMTAKELSYWLNC